MTTARIPRSVLAMLFAAGCAGDSAGYDTHAVVAATVHHFAPGVELGGGIERMSVNFRDRRWIPHLGAVTQASHARFTQLRFFPDDDVRRYDEIDTRAPLRAVEMVSLNPTDREHTMSEVAIAFGADPVEGCITPADTTLPLRTVQYWIAPDSAGGIAIVGDWMQQAPALIDGRLWSLWAWSGRFTKGGPLRTGFAPQPCDRRPAVTARDREDAYERFERAFRDSTR